MSLLGLVSPPPAAPTAPSGASTPSRGARHRAAPTGRSPLLRTVAVVAVVFVLAEVMAAVLPADPLVGVLTPLRLVVLVGLAAVAADGGFSRDWRPGTLTVLVVVLLLATALTCQLTGVGWPQWRALLTGVGVATLTWGLLRRDDEAARGLELLALIALATVSVMAIGQIASGTPTGFCRGSLWGDQDVCTPGAAARATATLWNPNILATALVTLLPISAGAVGGLRQATMRTVGWCVLGAGAIALLFTWSRAGVLALLVAAGAYVGLRLPGRWARYGAAAAALLVVAGGAYVALGGDAGARGPVWRAALRVVATHPVGVGLGGAGAELQARTPGGPAYEHAHNLWLNWFVEAGLLGGLCVVAATVLLFVTTLRAARAGVPRAATYGAALAGFAAANVVDYPANADRMALLMWVVVGMVASTWWSPSRAAQGTALPPD